MANPPPPELIKFGSFGLIEFSRATGKPGGSERPKDHFSDLSPGRHGSLIPSAEIMPCGLLNPKNLSFLNATLQALLVCSPFVLFLSELRTKSVSMVEFPCLAAFYKLVNAVGLPSGGKRYLHGFGTPFYPSMFHEVLKNFTPDVLPPAVRPREEDAQRFLRFVMDHMQKELLNLEGKSSHNGVESSLRAETSQTFVSSKLSSVFEGELCSAINLKENTSSFLVLRLDISPRNVVRLEDALHQFCDRDKGHIGRVAASPKDVRIKKLPEIMILHLDRFTGSIKEVKPVRFPLELVLGPGLLFSTRRTPPTKETYKLISTISHHGEQVSKGHYTTHALYPDGQWLRFDDASVTAIDTSKVPLENAYILFYKKKKI